MGKPAEELADDATLATDIVDEEERRRQQMEYYGGDIDDDADDFDPSKADRGDNLEIDAESEDRGDEVKAEKEEEGEDAEAEDDESEDDADSDDDDSDDEAEDEIADDDDEADDDEDGDEDSESDGDDSSEEQSDAAAKGDQRIPLSRFNEVNERMKRAEARLAQLEKQEEAEDKAEVQAYDFDAAEAEYMDLLLDGKTTEAAAKRREIRTAEKADFLSESEQKTTQTVSQTAMINELNSLTDQAQSMYPVLNESHADYNPAVAQKTVTFMKGYVSDGMDPSEAFVAALADTIDLYNLDGNKATEQPKPEKKVTKKKAIEKKAEKKKVREQQHRTPAGEGRGSADAGAVVPDISKLSDAEIDALPPETLARLRGDFVD